MLPGEIEARIASFPKWHYEFDLAGHRTPISTHRNRQHERASYIFDPLLRLYRGSLSGKRVLDLGCNAGYWALRAVESGADYVLGIDGRQMHIDQANFVFEVKGIEGSRYEFLRADVYEADLSAKGPFEIVLCLGLLYHVSDPATLIERIGELNTESLVIDTGISRMPGRFLELRRESAPEHPLAAIRDQFVTFPTREAVIAMAQSAGYVVTTLRPAFASYAGAPDYRDGSRRAFVCTRDPERLGAIADRAERATTPRLLWDVVRWRAWRATLRTRARASGVLRRRVRD